MWELIDLLKRELAVIIVGATPIFELRGAIPLGVSMGFTPIQSTILSIIGNILPIPFLLLLLKPIFKFLRRYDKFDRIIEWIENRTLRRSKRMKKYTLLGLYLLVAVPLPTTGAYTGSLAASLFNIRFKFAFPTIVAGVITAGVIMYILSSIGVMVLV
ncbi:COG2426 family protein [Senegalia massiliensis]|uniref:Ligand-binding protein SH3 n=1 Tax=Senegalia massiliensis TaxID=1720316 RepID=A0A845R4F2_9CLOT|nr:small multi-drug export protein [Senegalia massiliensis]NBI07383.1 ligand-binding protein SH3 [Senegalia massiliensis]